MCILDFEATCWDTWRNDLIREIIEFPSILYKVDYQNKIEYVDEFQQYVRPIVNPNLSEFCTSLTGITQETVNKADYFPIVYKKHIVWLESYISEKDKLIFLTCGNWDLKTMLPIETTRHKLKLRHWYTKYLNLKDEFEKCYKSKCGGMMNMLTKLNIEHTETHHSGIDDCRNLAKVVIAMVEKKHKFTW